MFNKFSTKTLIVIFGVLLVVTLVIFYGDLGNTKRTFRDELITIDTAAVSKMVITPKTKTYGEVELTKVDGQWYVKVDEKLTVPVPSNKIVSLYNQFATVKPSRMATRNKDKWAQYEVDETNATRLRIWEGSSMALDIMLGKFAFKQPRSISSFVRLTDENDVYEIDGLLAASFNSDANSYRNPAIIKGTYKNWNRVDFSYPADSSFTLVKVDNKWKEGNTLVDSANTTTWLRMAASLSGRTYVDYPDPELVKKPTHVITVETEVDTVVVKGYKSGETFLVNSSKNPTSYFDATKDKLAEKLFVGKSKFYKK